MTTKPNTTDTGHVIPAFALLNYRKLSEVVRQLYYARFRSKDAEVFVEFEQGGKWYRVPVDNDAVAREILGALWLQSHHEKRIAHRRRRREKAR